jgi:hypothetical protein
MFCSYTGREHLNVYPIGQPPIKYSKFLMQSLSQIFCVQKRSMWLYKRNKKKSMLKIIDKCPRKKEKEKKKG